jgi:hypothetical protein
MALGMLYILALFFAYALLLVLPEMLDVLAEVPPGPAQEKIAKEAVHEAFGGKFYIALGGAICTVLLGAHLQVLPGLSASKKS